MGNCFMYVIINIASVQVYVSLHYAGYSRYVG
jgi:hypothetical protein